MRFVHTSDWHLGQTWHQWGRDREHRAFLAWLLDCLVETKADALLIAGDIFDVANPPNPAQRLWFDFVASLRSRLPGLQVVAIAGNHDSPARLESARDLLLLDRIHVVGAIGRDGEGRLRPAELLVPLVDASGSARAVVAAVPYLRTSDLEPIGDEFPGDPLVEGVRRIYGEVVAAAATLHPGVPVIAMGHGYLVGTRLSADSERRVLGGNEHPLPADIFGEGIAYTALGHLHMAQRVAGRDDLRYSGSPLPLSMSEIDYRHQVLVVDVDEAGAVRIEERLVPRLADVRRIPRRGASPLAEILVELAALPPREAEVDIEAWPFLEVDVRLDAPEPRLRERIVEALADRAARLVRIGTTLTAETEVAVAEGEELPDLDDREVLRRIWRQSYEGEVPEDLARAYDLLVEIARHGESTS